MGTRLLLTFITFILASVGSRANVVGFDELPVLSGQTVVRSGGFVFTSISTSPTSLVKLTVQSCCGGWPSNGTKYLLQNNFGDRQHHTILMESEDGGHFSLRAFDAAERHFELHHAARLELIGTYADGSTTSAVFPLDGVNDGDGPLIDFETFHLPPTFTSLISVSFWGPVDDPIATTNGIDQGFVLDNVVADQVVTAPTTNVLLALGLLGMGYVSQRRTH